MVGGHLSERYLWPLCHEGDCVALGQAEGTSVEFKIVAYDNAGNSEVDDNGGQYYVYSVVPEFSSAIILAVIFAVAFVAVTIFRKIQPPK